MKKYVLIFFSAICYVIKPQSSLERCMSVDYLRKQYVEKSHNSGFYRAEQKVNQWLSDKNNYERAKNSQRTIITIPVVFHVVYKNAAQNIPDSLIHSQIRVLNECFRKQNTNYSNTRPIFDSLGADVEIEFCLAKYDPQGNPTTGIVRKQAPSNASFNPILGFDNVKKPSKGGDTIWPARQYLNIWTCDMSLFNVEVVLGYAQFPGMDSLTDGVVIQYNYIGKYSKPGFLGRTTVHEVGHWLGLRHIWADDDLGTNPAYCDSTDYVDDTPNQGPRSQTNCNLTANTCSVESAFWGNLNPPDMVENYMDYSRDSCMTLFTRGQKARMYGFLNTDPLRIAIKTSTAGCNAPVGVRENYKNLSLSVLPNPAGEYFEIHSDVSGWDNVIIRNTNMKTVLEWNKYYGQKFYIDNLPSGIYIIEIRKGHTSWFKKLIKE